MKSNKINQDEEKNDLDVNDLDVNDLDVNDLDVNDLDVNDLDVNDLDVNEQVYTQDKPEILSKAETKKETLVHFEQPFLRYSRKRTLEEIQQKMKNRPNIGQDLGSVY